MEGPVVRETCAGRAIVEATAGPANAAGFVGLAITGAPACLGPRRVVH